MRRLPAAGLLAALALVTAVACRGPEPPASPGPAASPGSAAPVAPVACPTPPARASSVAARPAPVGPQLLAVDVVAATPHDPDAFTQGLAYAGSTAGRAELYEGTGRDSSARRVDVATGEVLVERPLPAPLFGEGVALAGDAVVQLTWRDGVGLVRDGCTLEERSRFDLEGEGWGLASDGDVLWRSDGTDLLRAHDSATFEVRRELRVTDRGRPVERLNELDVVDGALLANVWRTPWIARIDLATGRVTGWVDARPLVVAAAAAGAPDDPEAVLNGIAWDAAGRRLWLTGKLWPRTYEVRLRPTQGELPPPGLP